MTDHHGLTGKFDGQGSGSLGQIRYVSDHGRRNLLVTEAVIDGKPFARGSINSGYCRAERAIPAVIYLVAVGEFPSEPEPIPIHLIRYDARSRTTYGSRCRTPNFFSARAVYQSVNQCQARPEIRDGPRKSFICRGIARRIEGNVEKDLADTLPVQFVQSFGKFDPVLRSARIVEGFVGCDEYHFA